MEGTVLEEDVFDEPLGYLCIDLFSCTGKVSQRQVVLNHDERSHPLLAHVHASHYDGEDGLTLVAELACVLVLVQSEETQEAMCLLSGPKVIEEAADVLLEKDDDGKRSYAHQLVEDASQQLHLQHLADDYPAADEEQDAIEDVDGARLLHQLVAIEKHDCYEEDVHYVLEANVRHRGNL